MLIAISGIDCAGKSTQIALLCRALSARGLRTSTFWLRPGYSTELDLLRRLVRRLRPDSLPHVHGDAPERERILQRPAVAASWVAMAALDMLAQWGMKLRARMVRDDVVICDRYLVDALIDLHLRFPQLGPWQRPLFEGLARLVPTPDVSLMLWLSPPEAALRALHKAEPFADAQELRQRRHAIYQRLALYSPMVVVDAAAPPHLVQQAILGHVLGALQARERQGARHASA